MIGQAEIARLIPHDGSMCLLQTVTRWDRSSIECQTQSHLALDNPLRSNDRLGVLCGIEYAAQAMALHGGLTRTAGDNPQPGFLASIRDVVCHVDRLDDINDDLLVIAQQLLNEGGRVIYQFSLYAGGRELLAGRAAVLLQEAA
jgi:predicted hotdog family 3-hydroxylacyl-ACP dehydratase